MRKLVFTLMALFVVFTLIRGYADARAEVVAGDVPEVIMGSTIR